MANIEQTKAEQDKIAAMVAELASLKAQNAALMAAQSSEPSVVTVAEKIWVDAKGKRHEMFEFRGPFYKGFKNVSKDNYRKFTANGMYEKCKGMLDKPLPFDAKVVKGEID